MESLKILIVEDDPTTCALLKTTLGMEGHKVAITHDVENEDILTLLNSEKPDILFLDYYLGTSETLPYLTKIRDDGNWQHVPILMTSAIDYGQDCLSAGADGFILKPFNWDELINMVNGICEQTTKRGDDEPRY
jgi:DNA-binding response OmpR family regulator